MCFCTENTFAAGPPFQQNYSVPCREDVGLGEFLAWDQIRMKLHEHTRHLSPKTWQFQNERGSRPVLPHLSTAWQFQEKACPVPRVRLFFIEPRACSEPNEKSPGEPSGPQLPLPGGRGSEARPGRRLLGHQPAPGRRLGPPAAGDRRRAAGVTSIPSGVSPEGSSKSTAPCGTKTLVNGVSKEVVLQCCAATCSFLEVLGREQSLIKLFVMVCFHQTAWVRSPPFQRPNPPKSRGPAGPLPLRAADDRGAGGACRDLGAQRHLCLKCRGAGELAFGAAGSHPWWPLYLKFLCGFQLWPIQEVQHISLLEASQELGVVPLADKVFPSTESTKAPASVCLACGLLAFGFPSKVQQPKTRPFLCEVWSSCTGPL